MLLTAHAGVGQEFLHVQQTTGDAVDAVFALAGSIEHAADADLGHVDGQQTHGVVEGERHLGTAERRALGGAGEDHVVHLLRAHGAGSLGTEHPRDGVDDVGLARSVRADHHGHPGLEVHHGVVGEGLEAFEGERLEKHDVWTLVHGGCPAPPPPG